MGLGRLDPYGQDGRAGTARIRHSAATDAGRTRDRADRVDSRAPRPRIRNGYQARDYQPQFQSRSEINFTSSFLRRFPRGDFELHAAGIYEYRGHTVFPLAAGDVQTGTAKTLSALLEIRILRAVVSYQQRNILGYPYEVVPGFEMPRVLAIYGVRWDFWN